MNAETFCEHFATFADAPNGIAKLRELILQLAVQGKLVSQDANDEPGNLLRSRIIAKRQQLIDSGEFTAFATDTEWPDGALPHTLPNGWEWIRLGELGGFLGGGTPSKERAEFWNGKIPWVSPKDMKRPYMDDAIDHVTPLGVENSSGKMIPKSSLLMVVRGMILAHSFPVALAMRELTINQDMKALQLALPELGEYLLRCCTACRSRMLESVERSSHGTCRLPTEAVANFPIPLPPLAEQRRIVEKVDQLLGLCDELAARQAAQREKRQRLVGATLDRLLSPHTSRHLACRGGLTASAPLDENITGAKANETPGQARWRVMQDDAHRLRNHFDQLFDTPTTIPQLRQTILQLAVQGQLVPQDPNDEPADAILANVHQRRRELVAEGTLAAIPKPVPLAEGEVGTTIPEHWRWARLNDLVSVMDSGWSPACDEEPTTDESEWGVLKTTAVQTLYFNQGAHKRLPSGLQPRPDSEAKAGDLLITRAGPQNRVGISCLVKTVRPRLMISDKIIRFHLIEPFLFEEFIALCLNAGPSQAHIERAKSGMAASQMNISQAKFRMTPIPIPPLAEQKRIVTKVTELLSLCDALEAKLTQAESASTQLLAAAVHHLLQKP